MNPLNIFIVDDDRDFAESVADVLEARGHRCEIALTGEEAVRIFGERDFDLTFMDVKLPGMNGVESFFEIRKIKPDARVMMMTAYSVEQLLEQAIDQGALGVLRKPFDPDELLGVLESVKPAGVVLVVDDYPDFAESIEKFLTVRGYNVLIAHSGEAAVETVMADSIDLLVLDLRLPVLSGLEVYMELKNRGRALPTVIVTGYAEEEAASIDSLHSMKATGCLVKPFDPRDLLAAIEALAGEGG